MIVRMPFECSRCHTRIAAESLHTLCPSCTAADEARELAGKQDSGGVPNTAVTPEKDHRGVSLPARHRVGGIITPQ
jgi:hypothetical protein